MSIQFSIPTMLFTNPTDHTIKLDALGLDPVGPKKDVEIPLTLAAPYRHDNGTRGKSPIEQVAPQLKPKDPKDFEIWMRVPVPTVGDSKIVTVAARPPSEAPGVKALLEAKAKAVVAPQTNVK